MKSPKKKKSEGKTVLLVDDERDWLSSMLDALGKEPYKLVIAESGESALKKLKSIKPDLILSNVRMPVMNGFDLYEQVRRDPKLKLIPYVFMLSIDDYDAMHVAKELGADDYVTKPFDDEDAKNIVSNLLTRFSK